MRDTNTHRSASPGGAGVRKINQALTGKTGDVNGDRVLSEGSANRMGTEKRRSLPASSMTAIGDSRLSLGERSLFAM